MSDPRVVTFDSEETVTVVGNTSHARAYHTEPDECSTVDQMSTVKEVSADLADWKGLDECDRCQAIRERRENPEATEGAAGSTRPVVTPAACRDLRERVLDGTSINRLVACLPWGRRRIRRHILGDCDHEHPDTPPLSNGWHVHPDPPAPSDGDSAVSTYQCDGVRRRLRNGMSAREAGKETNMSKSTAKRHARGRCPHDGAEPPLNYGWHPDAVGGQRVFVGRSESARYRRQIYHTHNDCRHLDDPITLARDALGDGFRECKQCADRPHRASVVSAPEVADD